MLRAALVISVFALVGCTGRIVEPRKVVVGGTGGSGVGGGVGGGSGGGGAAGGAGGGSMLSCADWAAQAEVGNRLYAQKCSSCHGGITVSTIANKTLAQINTALATVPQMNGLGATLSSDDLSAIAATLSFVPRPDCPTLLATSNFTRSSSEVMKLRVSLLFPGVDLSAMLNANTELGQSLGMPDFLSSFSVTTPDSAAAQAAFQKNVVAVLCAKASTSTMFSTQDVLMAGETLPADAATKMAFTAARNTWLVPYTAASSEVQLLVSLIQKLQADGAAAAEVQQGVCMAALSAPQFWKGNPGKFEALKRIALDIGGRRPTFAELSAFDAGTLSLSGYLQQIQSEPGYLQTVKTWHRNWFGPLDYGKKTDRLRGAKYWWALGGPTFWAGQTLVLQDSSGSLDPSIPIMRQSSMNSTEMSDSDSCQPFEQTFSTVTQRIQWEQRVNGQWYVIGGWKLVSGAWQSFGGSVPVGGSNVTTALSDIVMAPASTNGTKFGYASGALAALPDFGPTDRRVRRFTVPDDVKPNDPAPTTEQNGYSKVNLYWSGQPVYICNAFGRFVQTCAYRPPTGTATMPNSATWNASSGQLVMRMGNIFVGIDSLAHPNVLKDVQCSIAVAPDAVTFSNTGTPNAVLINADFNTGQPQAATWMARYPSLAAEVAAISSLREDMRDEPFNLVADIVASDTDYRKILTADWTTTRGPLELYYRLQGQYFPTYPPGAARLPGSTGYLDPQKYYPMTFNRLARGFFTGPTGGQLAGNYDGFKAQNSGAANSVIDDPTLPNLAPRPISGVLTQAAFLGPAIPKMRTVSARILRTFTCGEVNTYVPTTTEQVTHLKYIPLSEKGGAQHVDPNGSCFACHVNMDPLASALSEGFMLKVNPFTHQPILGGSEYLSALGEMAPFETDDVLEGFRYGVRGNLDLPSKGALFGQEVSGVREVGKVLSESDLFARCAVTQAFTSVFGRPPTLPEDQALMDQVKQQWESGGYSYNKLIELLVVSPQFQVRN